MPKKRIYLIAAVSAVIIILVILGVYFFFFKNKASNSSAVPTPAEEQIFTLKPEDIGLNLSLITSGKFANNGLEVSITKVSDIVSIDYQMDYTAAGGIPRGAIGHVDIKPTDTSFSQQLPFGTCSDKCHFDDGVTDVKITLKIVKKDGKSYSVEAPFNF